MKKVFKFMMMALAAVVLTVGFAACSSDDEEDKPINPEKTESYLDLNLTFTDDILAVFDVTVTYTDATGSDKTETVTNKEFSKKITYSKAPSTIAYSVKVVKKATIPAQDSYKIGCTTKTTLCKNGKGVLHSTSVNTQTSASKLDAYINRVNGTDILGKSI